MSERDAPQSNAANLFVGCCRAVVGSSAREQYRRGARRQIPGMAGAGAIQVLIGRFAPVVELGLVTLLQEDASFSVVASSLDTSAVRGAVARLSPSVAILGEDVDRQLICKLKARKPSVQSLVFVPTAPRLTDSMLRELGATCLTWSASPTQIRAAVRRVASGENAVQSQEQPHQRKLTIGDVLTKRERQVFAQLSRGASYASIGAELQISPETARTHTISICRKLGVVSKRDIVGESLQSTVGEQAG
jgi:DNA-binding NarL/FixJ family response regulator